MTYGTKTIKGVIGWYDEHSKRGSIWSLDGTPYRIHEFSDLGDYIPTEGDHVTFRLKKDSCRPIMKWVKKSKSKHKIKKTKREPVVGPVTFTTQDQLSGRIVVMHGFRVTNYHWIEVRNDDNKLAAVTGLFNDAQGPIEMWNGTWEQYCGYEDLDQAQDVIRKVEGGNQ